jgi:hypothetical protein
VASFNSSGAGLTPGLSLGPHSLSFAAAHNTVADLIVLRDDPNTFAQRNGTAAQTFRVYIMESSNLANFERLNIQGVAGSRFEISTSAGGTGAVRPLTLRTNGGANITFDTNSVSRWVVEGVTGAGHFLPVTHNTYDIGASGTAVRDVHIARDLATAGRTKISVVATASLPAAGATEDGRILIEDAGAGDRNVVIYAGGQRFRIDGGAAF